MTVSLTTCSRCRVCNSVLFDEEIMSGWSAEDSNFQTKCAFCSMETVPRLTVMVTDYRPNPPMSRGVVPSPGQASSEGGESNPGTSDPLFSPLPPVRHKPLCVPYISPLVLRRELESILCKGGDTLLTSPTAPDSHPVIYWNLVYLFHRIAVPSHLPGLLLTNPSLQPSSQHPAWADMSTDHRNVRVRTRWDNDTLYKEDNLPLYIQWRMRNCQVDPKTLHPLMHKVIQGVRENDLFQCVKDIITDRVRRAGGKESAPTPLDPAHLVSVYRQTLFLTLVSLGQDNIDLTAFDREYRRAHDKLTTKLLCQTIACDRPPHMGALFCRKLFRDLTI